MIGRPLRTIACLLAFAALVALSPARGQNLQPRPERDCGEIERDYELIKAEAVSVQINMALFAAADKGCEALARKLLDAGASLLARDRRGAGPLAHAARGGQIKLVELFLAKGAPIDARNVDGGTALFAAAEAEKHSTVALLLTKGADPNLPGRKGVTPLMAAAFKGNGRIFDALLHAAPIRTCATRPARRPWSMPPRAASTISWAGSLTPASTRGRATATTSPR